MGNTELIETKKKARRGKGKMIIITAIIILLAVNIIGACLLVGFAIDADSPFSASKMVRKVYAKNSTSVEKFVHGGGSEEDADWFDNCGENVYITSDDGLKLRAVNFINESGNGNYVIVCHGYAMGCESVCAYAKFLYDEGYSVICPDARAHGQSEGRVRGMGWLERKDMLKWIDKVIEMNPGGKIALFGVSMGGATVMMTSGEELPPQVSAIVEDCGYSSAWDQFEKEMGTMFHLPSFPLLNIADVITKITCGYSLKEASSVNQLANCSLPMLFIHGSEDKFVPPDMIDICYDADADSEKEKFVVEGAGHGASFYKAGDVYKSKVIEFLNKYMES